MWRSMEKLNRWVPLHGICKFFQVFPLRPESKYTSTLLKERLKFTVFNGDTFKASEDTVAP